LKKRKTNLQNKFCLWAWLCAGPKTTIPPAGI
jgi:hypothetical protein